MLRKYFYRNKGMVSHVVSPIWDILEINIFK